MSSSVPEAHRIGRLTPLKDVLARIADEISLVAGREVSLADAIGKVLAADVHARTDRPAAAIALRDGYAVRADDTTAASSYAPVPLANARAVQAGDAMPAEADAVVPPDGVTDVGGIAAVSAVAGGDGVLAAGADARAGTISLGAGHKLREIDVAVLQALGVKTVNVRVPRVVVVVAKTSDIILDSIAGFAERFAAKSGGEAAKASSRDFRAALSQGDPDFIVVVGGSGLGARDDSIASLQKVGHLHFHGVGIAPGETSALGFADKVPVLVVPGRLDAALVALATMGDAILAHLSGRTGEAPIATATLERKVVSTIGLVELVPVALKDGRALPLASGYLPMQTMMRAGGYVVVPADSEGFPAGSTVAVRIMP